MINFIYYLVRPVIFITILCCLGIAFYSGYEGIVGAAVYYITYATVLSILLMLLYKL